MFKTLILLLLLLPKALYGQIVKTPIQKRSPMVWVYKVNAQTAEKFIRSDSIPVDDFLQVDPIAIFPADSVDHSKLALGQYVMISVEDNRLKADLSGVSNMAVYPVNNKKRVQLVILDKEWKAVSNARVWVGKREAIFQPEAKSYRVTQKNPDEAVVKVMAPGDTLFSSLSPNDLDDWDDLKKSLSSQRWVNFKNTGIIKVLSWFPSQIQALFSSRRHFHKSGSSGMMVFNQPKYKRTDTVKLKAYIFDSKRKPFKKPLDVFLRYYVNGVSKMVFLQNLPASSPGSYIMNFPLSDSLPTDINYQVVFQNKKKQELLSKGFKIEDYLLDEISSYDFRSDKETYFLGDTIHLFASAKNSNGQYLLDGRARLALYLKDIHGIYLDSVFYIPDTLFGQELNMVTSGDTKFDFVTRKIPDANLDIEAELLFINSNNEIQEKSKMLYYRPHQKELSVRLVGDSILAEYRENGKVKEAEGLMKSEGVTEGPLSVHYPYSIKVNGIQDNYTFFLIQNGRVVDSAKVEMDYYYYVGLQKTSHGDSLGFVLNNPMAIPVSFSVFDGNKQVGSGRSSEKQILWTIANPSIRKGYRVNWQYFWKGKENFNQKNIAFFHKILDMHLQENPSVFPGQTDQITVEVKDYRHRPIEGVNLTAVGYNSQFGKDLQWPNPPYLARYKIRPHLERSAFDVDDGYIIKKFHLGEHTNWIRKLGLDTMLYYKMLFPPNGIFDAVSLLGDPVPQVSIHMVASGERQEIYLLHLNRSLVYYNGVTEKMKDAYAVFPGYTQVGIRLYDRFIEIDSIYVQPGYKHDLFFDLNHLPPNSKVNMVPDSLTRKEKSELDQSLWNLDNNSLTNDGYVWQGLKLVKLSGSHRHLVGPFLPMDSIHFYAPGAFDLHFVFEPGYQYDISKGILRLEKIPLFPDDGRGDKLLLEHDPVWVIGDTLERHPEVVYQHPPIYRKSLTYSNRNDPYWNKPEVSGNLFFTSPPEKVLNYIILYPVGRPEKRLVLSPRFHIYQIPPGTYTLMLIDSSWGIAENDNLLVKPHQTVCFSTNHWKYQGHNSLIDQWIEEEMNPSSLVKEENKHGLDSDSIAKLKVYETGLSEIEGRVTDKRGRLAIPSATIQIKGYRTGTMSDLNGRFKISKIQGGACKLVVSALGYVSKELAIVLPAEGSMEVNIALEVSTQSLNEVVVTTIGFTNKKDLAGSIAAIRVGDMYFTGRIVGKAAGVSSNTKGDPGSGEKFSLRGIASSGGQSPAYLIDGIFYDQMPSNITEDMITNVQILKGEEATSQYGSKGVNGLVVITTQSKTVRNVFRDYAFWVPEIFTDKNGHASFKVTYPDNVTSWQNYVVGIDPKRRVGSTLDFVTSFKPLSAQLNLPEFLIIGDSTEIIGKALNFSNDRYSLQSHFQVNGNSSASKEISLEAKASSISTHSLLASSIDTLRAGYFLSSSTGFQDGEEKKIPVLPKGSLETKGDFWVIDHDTTIEYHPLPNGDSVVCYIQNNTLDLLLDELKYLKKYPYYCMEQTASKLRGLLAEKKIVQQLGKKFEESKTIDFLVQKLQKNQLYEGAWSWWENGKANLYITNYVIEALLPMRAEGMVETNIRNGLLFLQNELPHLGKQELLSALLTLSDAKHLINYENWLQKIDFDSLDVYQQWEYVKILQNQNIPHDTELKKLMGRSNKNYLGALHWGDDNYRWYSDANAVTVLAFEVLQHESGYEQDQKSIMQYFLEQRRNGFWRNTVASASIVSALLPYLLSENRSFTQPTEIAISGDTNLLIRKFPYSAAIRMTTGRDLKLHKSGGGLTYVTLYQQAWNKRPEPVNQYFEINSYFEQNGQKVSYLKAGHRTKMKIQVNAYQDGEYLALEIPIPAGCTYGSKDPGYWEVHREYVKNKVLLFIEKMSKGIHYYEIDLEPRYSGTYTLNPAKVSLMYFPLFYGRNTVQEITLVKDPGN